MTRERALLERLGILQAPFLKGTSEWFQRWDSEKRKFTFELCGFELPGKLQGINDQTTLTKFQANSPSYDEARMFLIEQIIEASVRTLSPAIDSYVRLHVEAPKVTKELVADADTVAVGDSYLKVVDEQPATKTVEYVRYNKKKKAKKITFQYSPEQTGTTRRRESY